MKELILWIFNNPKFFETLPLDTPLTEDEFDEKYKDFLEEGHYGMAINNETVIIVLDYLFKTFTLIPGFSYSQIKMKFGSSRFYANIDTFWSHLAESIINIIIKEDLNKFNKEVIDKFKEKKYSKS